MFVHYDTAGDFVEVRFGKPTPSYYENLGDDVFKRMDEKTGKVKGYAFFNVKTRKRKEPRDIVVDVPVV